MTVPATLCANTVPLPETRLYIAGKWRAAKENKTFPVFDPATGMQLAKVCDATPADALDALEAACHAGPTWAATPPRVRSEILRRAFDLLMARADYFAALITAEMGKPLAQSLGEVRYGAEFLRWFAEEAVRLDGRWGSTPEGNLKTLVTSRPVGPCLLITPWNFPLAMATRKAGPALAAGCTVVLKPSELTPLTALAWVELMEEAGVPAGVINVIPTTCAPSVCQVLLADPRLRKLSFTGSTAVGKELARQSAGGVLRTSLELGGNAPFIVFDDADVDVAVSAAVAAKMRNMGQACTAANRFIIGRNISEVFLQKFVAAMRSLPLGNGFSSGCEVGPLITDTARQRLHAKVQAAVAGGAKVLCGGFIPDSARLATGAFYPPTVLSQVDPQMDIFSEEIFGPVAPIVLFDTPDQAFALANATGAGLAAYVCTSNLPLALSLPEVLHFGLIGLNEGVISNAARPFGGVKESGLGREGGAEGIFEYTETVYMAFPN